jgi:hypothetical protein
MHDVDKSRTEILALVWPINIRLAPGRSAPGRSQSQQSISKNPLSLENCMMEFRRYTGIIIMRHAQILDAGQSTSSKGRKMNKLYHFAMYERGRGREL